MTVTNISKDPDRLVMTVTCEFEASVDRLWQVWADPRQLERWWGPPTYPATVTEHALAPGGRVRYHMIGPEGDRHGGWWRVIAVEPPHRLEFQDGFSGDDGEPDEAMPTTMVEVTLRALDGSASRMTMVSTFPSLDAMERMIEMGVEAGTRQALGQIDGVLAAAATER